MHDRVHVGGFAMESFVEEKVDDGYSIAAPPRNDEGPDLEKNLKHSGF